jgi:hypothetical protein
MRQYCRKYYRANRKRLLEYAAAYRRKNQKKLRAAARTAWAKIPRAKRRAISRARTERGRRRSTLPRPAHCELCDAASKSTLHRDHDHITGQFRGWLCCSCNWGLGNFKDNPALLRKAAEFLENARTANKRPA